MSIFDNHEQYNKFQVFNGFRMEGNHPVSAYILECKLKKIIRPHITVDMLKQLSAIKNKNRQDERFHFRIKSEDVFEQIVTITAEATQELITLYEQEGILECLIRLMKLKK